MSGRWESSCSICKWSSSIRETIKGRKNLESRLGFRIWLRMNDDSWKWFVRRSFVMTPNNSFDYLRKVWISFRECWSTIQFIDERWENWPFILGWQWELFFSLDARWREMLFFVRVDLIEGRAKTLSPWWKSSKRRMIDEKPTKKVRLHLRENIWLRRRSCRSKDIVWTLWEESIIIGWRRRSIRFLDI